MTRRRLAGALLALGLPMSTLSDELSLELAPRVVAQIHAVLRRLNEDGLTIVVVEQHLPAVVACAHHLYSLARGEVTAHGTPAEVAADLTRSFGVTAIGGRSLAAVPEPAVPQ